MYREGLSLQPWQRAFVVDHGKDAGLLRSIGVDLHPEYEKTRHPTLFHNQALKTDDVFDMAYEAAEKFGAAYGRRVVSAAFRADERPVRYHRFSPGAVLTAS